MNKYGIENVGEKALERIAKMGETIAFADLKKYLVTLKRSEYLDRIAVIDLDIKSKSQNTLLELQDVQSSMRAISVFLDVPRRARKKLEEIRKKK